MQIQQERLQHVGQGIEAIAIGASAGGVEALGTLLASLPQTFQLPVFIVLHLPPDRSTMLPQLLSRRCPLPVKEAEDKEPVTPGTVYFAAPDYHLLVEPDRTFSLSRDEPIHYSRPSIDLLFESAAFVYRKHLLGIVLTGASQDGAEGLKQIRECGGAAWVQDPEEATSSTMPAAALARAGADAVMPLAAMVTRLSRLTPGFTHQENKRL